MTELASVRAEIKAWERSFKKSNGRAATVEDVRQNNAIADKYKLYKKLSKTTTKEKTPPIFSTPPRPTPVKEPSSVILSRSRVVQPTAPLAAFNPFSPQKKQKGKEKNSFSPIDGPRRNLFGTPCSSSQGRGLSPLPLIRPSSSSTPSYDNTMSLPAEPTSPVSRARKRLRGEPVSPSPSKEKRRRIAPHTNLFPRLNLDASGSDDEMDTKKADSSFVANSPMKLPSSGKLFPKLFSENEHLPSDLFSQTKSTKNKTFKSTRRAANMATEQAVNPKRSISRPELAGKYKASTANSRVVSETPSKTSIHRSTNKRPASDDEAGVLEHVSPRQKSPLIPPSPPPSANVFNRSSQLPSKSQASKPRKKVKIDESSTSDSDDTELTPKIVRRETRIKHDGGVQTWDEASLDPILGQTRFAGPHAETAQLDGGRVEINLPDQLRRVLALGSVAPQSKLPDENRVVNGLLYGRRMSHYDPNKGGEIWDIGESYHTRMDEQGRECGDEEEDWEGEPVPWEIAEL